MKSLLRLLPYFSRYKKMFYKGVVLVLLSSLAEVLWPRFFGAAIDSVISGKATLSTLLISAGEILFFSVLSGFFYYLVRQNIIVASRLIEADLRSDLFAHLERLSMRFFQNTPQGEVMAYMTNDIDAVRYFIGPAVMYSANTLATFIATFGYMLALEPKLSLLTVLPLPLMSFLVYVIGRKVHPLFDAVQGHFADMTARTTESISGMRVVRAYVRETYEKGIFNALAKGYFDKNMRLAKLQGLMQPVIFGFMGVSNVLLLLIGGKMILNHTLTVGTLTQFYVYLGVLTWPFIALGFVTNMVQRGAASMARLIKIFETEPEIQNSTRTDWRITDLKGDIEFNKVSFRYKPELRPVLHNISLRIPRGSTLAIIGRTGAGKTSFINLISRLFDPTEGSITIDGHDLRTIPVEILRGHIGFVTQEPYLFSETLSENISFGGTSGEENLEHFGILGRSGNADTTSNLTAESSEAMPHFPKLSSLGFEEAAKSADIYDNIMDFPMKFETVIGERGITLSGGQKQRTAIARAIARNPRILVLDDAMSAVDTATEERILRNMRSSAGERTTILISHRTSTAKEADNIIVLDHGEIVESGRHTELLQLRGHYHNLYRRQLLEDSLKEA